MRRSSHLQESKREEGRTYYTCCGSISALSSAALGCGRRYCPVGSGTSTKFGRDGVSSLQVTRYDLLTGSTTSSMSSTWDFVCRYLHYGSSLTSRRSSMWSADPLPLAVLVRPAEQKRRPRRDRHRGDISAMDLGGRRRGSCLPGTLSEHTSKWGGHRGRRGSARWFV